MLAANTGEPFGLSRHALQGIHSGVMQVKAAVTLGYQQPFVIKDVDVSPPGKDEILVQIFLRDLLPGGYFFQGDIFI